MIKKWFHGERGRKRNRSIYPGHPWTTLIWQLQETRALHVEFSSISPIAWSCTTMPYRLTWFFSPQLDRVVYHRLSNCDSIWCKMLEPWWTMFKSSTIWLVVSTPLKNISQLGWLFPIYGKNVPNHQPAILLRIMFPCCHCQNSPAIIHTKAQKNCRPESLSLFRSEVLIRNLLFDLQSTLRVFGLVHYASLGLSGHQAINIWLVRPPRTHEENSRNANSDSRPQRSVPWRYDHALQSGWYAWSNPTFDHGTPTNV